MLIVEYIGEEVKMKFLKIISVILGAIAVLGGCAYGAGGANAINFTESELPGGGIKVPHNERLHLSTDQQWIHEQGHLSDLIRLQWTDPQAKPALVWADEKGADKTAIISHAKANNPEQHDHNHISIETTMSPTGKNAGQLFTRLEVPFDTDVAEIRTHSSNFNVMDGLLRIAGSKSANKDLELATRSGPENETTPRWKVRADSTSETGGNSGSNFGIVRYSDNGEALDTPLFIQRSNGNVGIGATDPTKKMDINDSGIRIRKSYTPASATAPGNPGEIGWDQNYVYICVAPNTWKRTQLSSW